MDIGRNLTQVDIKINLECFDCAVAVGHVYVNSIEGYNIYIPEDLWHKHNN